MTVRAAGADTTVNQILMSGVDLFSSDASLQDLNVTNAQLSTVYALNNTVNTASGNANLTVNYQTTTGTADVAKLAVNNAGGKVGTATVRQDVAVVGAVEGVELATAGTNYVDLAAGTGAKTITVTGNGTNDVEVTSAAATFTLDASATTGTNTFNVGTALISTDTIKGGSGSDTLVAELPRALNYNPTVTGVETLRLTTDVTNTTYNASKTTGITTLTFDDIVDSGNATISNLAATATTVNIGREATIDAGGVTVGYASKSDSDVTINLGATSTTADPSVAVTGLTVTGNSGALTINSTGDAADADGQIQGNLTVDSVTELSLVAVANKLTVTGNVEANAADTILIDGTLKEISIADGGDTVSADTLNNLTVNSGAGVATVGKIDVAASGENLDTTVTLNTGAKNLTIDDISATGAKEYTASLALNVNGGVGNSTLGAVTVAGDATSTAAANVTFTADVEGATGAIDIQDTITVASFDKGTISADITVVGGEGLVDINDAAAAVLIDAENKALTANISLTSGRGGLNAGGIAIVGGAEAASSVDFSAEAVLGALTVDLLDVFADYKGSTTNVGLAATSANVTVSTLLADVSVAHEQALNIDIVAASGKSVTIIALDDGAGTAADLQSVTTAGAGDVTIGNNEFSNTYDTTVDATQQTGALNINLSSSSGNLGIYLGNAASGKTNIVSSGSGADNIFGGTGADSIQGGAGNDVVALNSGADKVLFETTLALNGLDEVTGFTFGALGNGGDILLFDFGVGTNLSQTDLRGTGANYEALAGGAALGVNTGLVKASADIADATAAELFAEGLTGEGAGDKIYLLTSTDASASSTVSLYYVAYAGAGDAAVTLIGTFTNATLDDAVVADFNQFTAP